MEKLNFQTVIIEGNQGPLEFLAAINQEGEVLWRGGRYLLTGRPCVRLGVDFSKRIREAIGLKKGQQN